MISNWISTPVVQSFRPVVESSVLEARGPGELHAELLFYPREHLGGQQRMTTELEEVVIDADRLLPEATLPDRASCSSILPRCARSPASVAPFRVGWQRFAVDLAVRRQRETPPIRRIRRDHVVRQLLLKAFRRSRMFRCGQIGSRMYTPRVCVAIPDIPGPTTASLIPRAGPARIRFSQLRSVAPHLH